MLEPANPQDRELEDSELDSVSGGREPITLEYGGLVITYTVQNPAAGLP
jgi:hypothetical protein